MYQYQSNPLPPTPPPPASKRFILWQWLLGFTVVMCLLATAVKHSPPEQDNQPALVAAVLPTNELVPTAKTSQPSTPVSPAPSTANFVTLVPTQTAPLTTQFSPPIITTVQAATPTGVVPPTPTIILTPAAAQITVVQKGDTVVQAWVSDPKPKLNTKVTVFGQLLVKGQPVNGAQFFTVWNYRTTKVGCDKIPVTGNDGLAACSRVVSDAGSNFEVKVDISFIYNGQTYTGKTSFTPQ